MTSRPDRLTFTIHQLQAALANVRLVKARGLPTEDTGGDVNCDACGGACYWDGGAYVAYGLEEWQSVLQDPAVVRGRLRDIKDELTEARALVDTLAAAIEKFRTHGTCNFPSCVWCESLKAYYGRSWRTDETHEVMGNSAAENDGLAVFGGGAAVPQVGQEELDQLRQIVDERFPEEPDCGQCGHLRRYHTVSQGCEYYGCYCCWSRGEVPG